jgi:hypothetical protein
MGAAEAVGAEDVPSIGTQHLIGGGHPQSWPARRIEVLNDRLDVESSLIGRHGAAGGRDGYDVEQRSAKGNTHCHGIVDAGVHVEDYSSRHSLSALERAPAKRSPSCEPVILRRRAAILKRNTTIPYVHIA